jgi:hypothetical protein
MVSSLSVLLEEFALDGSFARFGLLATTPVIFCVSIVSLVTCGILCIEGLMPFHLVLLFTTHR